MDGSLEVCIGLEVLVSHDIQAKSYAFLFMGGGMLKQNGFIVAWIVFGIWPIKSLFNKPLQKIVDRLFCAFLQMWVLCSAFSRRKSLLLFDLFFFFSFFCWRYIASFVPGVRFYNLFKVGCPTYCAARIGAFKFLTVHLIQGYRGSLYYFLLPLCIQFFNCLIKSTSQLSIVSLLSVQTAHSYICFWKLWWFLRDEHHNSFLRRW